ncbi:sporulation membrane protein YtaF [Desulfotruncus alcoholivorax]|uniref:sporulation membrane protein YtaF n=1 Tax=Desulfotruncus alcoholivorax TaxID=265477 RepID=UPI00047F5A7D|nr:sporulation membrane protein YtaF [Desulfotruncus alcoholivorax]
MSLLMIIIFALSLSLDALSTGVAYGIKNIKVPIISLLIICMMSVMAISVSMTLGHVMTNIFSISFTHHLGGAILLVIGLWMIFQRWQESRLESKTGHNQIIMKQQVEQKLIQIRIKALGLIISILREPSEADLDKSGQISAREAVLLGFALAMDAFGAGFAVAMLGFNPVLTALMVGLGQIILTSIGLMLGRIFVNSSLGTKIAASPGFIFIAMGLYKMHN